jgi:hypothetical protein
MGRHSHVRPHTLTQLQAEQQGDGAVEDAFKVVGSIGAEVGVSGSQA